MGGLRTWILTSPGRASIAPTSALPLVEAMEAAGVVLRAGGDEQDPDGRGDHRHVEHPRVRQAPADPRGLRALEEITLAVVEQLPRQLQELGGRLLGQRDVGVGGAGFDGRVHLDGEAAPGAGVDRRRPALASIAAQACMTFAA